MDKLLEFSDKVFEFLEISPNDSDFIKTILERKIYEKEIYTPDQIYSFITNT